MIRSWVGSAPRGPHPYACGATIMDAKTSEPWELDFATSLVVAPGKRSRFRPSLVEWLSVIAIVGILVALLQPAVGDRDYSRKLPPASGRASDPALASVAGEYYRGDGLGVNWMLELTPDGRYSFLWSGCLGVYEKDWGYYRLKDGKVQLSQAKPPLKPRESGKPWIERVPTGLRLIRWGTRRYLIPDEEKQAFCEAVRTGREPRTGSRGRFFLADVPEAGEELKDVLNGLPDVPDSWKSMLTEVAGRK